MKYSQVKECIESVGRSGLEDLIKQYDENIIEAGLECDVTPDNIAEAYQGQYESDEEFVQQLLEDCGDIPELPNYVYIDWEKTANDVMMDYSEHNGYYFRNL